MPKLTIVVPAYNERRTLRSLLCAVLDVDLSPLGLTKEIIVIDDGSTDGTREIVLALDRDAIAELRPLLDGRAALARSGFRIESLQWLNMFGIPGWWLNARVLKRDRLPAFQMAVYNVLSRVVLPIESWIGPPVGLSLVAVATPQDHARASAHRAADRSLVG